MSDADEVAMTDWFSQLADVVTTHADQAPFLLFCLMSISGFNLPIPEDLMIFAAAGLGRAQPELIWPLYTGLFFGVLCGDIICYSLGRWLGPRLAQISWFASMLSPERIDQISAFYRRFGIFTLIVGRFIPFGVRNALLLAAGLGKMHFARLFIADVIAVGASTGGYFWLYLSYGDDALRFVQENQWIFVPLVLFGVVVALLRRRRRT